MQKGNAFAIEWISASQSQTLTETPPKLRSATSELRSATSDNVSYVRFSIEFRLGFCGCLVFDRTYRTFRLARYLPRHYRSPDLRGPVLHLLQVSSHPAEFVIAVASEAFRVDFDEQVECFG